MAVYFKFKSAKEFNSLPIVGQYISIGNLKERIFDLKHLGRGTDVDLIVSNARTNEEYTDEDVLIPRNTSVLIRRVPGHPRMRVVANSKGEKRGFRYQPGVAAQHSTTNVRSLGYQPEEESEWDYFVKDPYAIVPQGKYVSSSSSSSSDLIDEDSRLQAILETSALDWSSQNNGPRGRGRMMRGRGSGIGRGLFENRIPPPGYVCHRCNIIGHFIQHCLTNGNPAYDPKRFKPPTGIPKSMLVTTPDGSYTLPGGVAAVLQPDEAAFEKAIDGIPTLARAAIVSDVCIYALICLCHEFCVLLGSFLQVLVQEKILWTLLNQSDSLEKFIIQHMLDFVLLLPILKFTFLFCFLSCNL